MAFVKRYLEILYQSLDHALREMRRNKLRTFLSLFGITIGIFCVIGVLTMVHSLEANIRKEMNVFGRNIIYVDKWDYKNSGPDFPFWKYASRPEPRHADIALIEMLVPAASHVAFKISGAADVGYQHLLLRRVQVYGLSGAFHQVQPVELVAGHYFSPADVAAGSRVAIIGSQVAEALFGSIKAAPGRDVKVRGIACRVIGVVRPQGRQMLGGWGFDESVLLPYHLARTILDEKRADPLILVKGNPSQPLDKLKTELRLAMRSIHQLRPGQEDDFSLNDINEFGTIVTSTFSTINMAGWSIGSLAFIVGIFGIANIMFVTVKERTRQVGLKKALGATSKSILYEFLLEASILSIAGGLIGLALVWALTLVVRSLADFPVFLPFSLIGLALAISFAAGIAAGLWPAWRAASADPAVAIRS